MAPRRHVDLRISHAVSTVPPLHNRCAGHCCGRSRRDQPSAKPGDRRAVLPRQDHQHLCRLVRRRRLRHLRPAAGAPFRQAHPRAADHRGAKHARRRLEQGGELHLQRRAQGRHRDRRDLPRRDPAAAVRRHHRPARPQQVHLSRQRQRRRLSLLLAHRRRRQELPRRARQGGDPRRLERRRHHPRPAGDDDQSRRRQIPHRHRLCRLQGDRARGRAQGSRRRLRHRLDRLHHALSALVREEARRHDAAAFGQGPCRAHQDGRAAGSRIRAQQGRPPGDGAGPEPGHVRAAVRAAAGRASRNAPRRCARRSWRR